MKHVKKSILLWYSPREMYDLVVGVTDYPKFLPWCQKAEVSEHTDEGMVARLHLAYAGVRHAFTTRNRHVPGERVHMQLVDGPFSQLDGQWHFVPLGSPAPHGQGEGAAAAPAQAQACRVEFELSYEFSSRVLEVAVSPVFDRIANTFVDAFVTRAEQVYGRR
jgi:ribosome-associated toxin RatA of RatAB toxin-antitoxin module